MRQTVVALCVGLVLFGASTVLHAQETDTGRPGPEVVAAPVLPVGPASEQVVPELLDAALKVPARELAVSYASVSFQLELVTAFAPSSQDDVNVFLHGEQVTPGNEEPVQRSLEERVTSYGAAVRQRGFRQVAGRYVLEAAQPCDEEFPRTGEIRQDRFHLELALDTPGASDPIPGVVVEDIVLLGQGDVAGGLYLVGTVLEGRIDLLPLSGPGCVLMLIRQETKEVDQPEPSPVGGVTDRIGDALSTPVIRGGGRVTPVVPVLPDLQAARIESTGGTVTATVSLAAGTLSRTDTNVCVHLDTDENPATGGAGQGADSASSGWDYSICAVNPRGSTTAQVSRALGPNQPGRVLGVGSSIVTFPGADQVRFSVPLSLIGNDDGRFRFKVSSMQWADAPIGNTADLDWMPDVGQPAGVVR